jgi:hypothetical protein
MLKRPQFPPGRNLIAAGVGHFVCPGDVLGERRQPHLKGLKVLVIDDSKTIGRPQKPCRKEGCEVFTAVDGFDALAKVADYTRTSCSSTS